MIMENFKWEIWKKKERRGLEGKVADAVKIIRFFAISLIIFGIFNIGTGSYAIYKRSQDIANTPIKPIITIKKKSEKQLTLVIESEIAINEVCYSWNNDQETKINGNGRAIIEEDIEFPAGENMLNIRAVDASGQTESLQQSFKRESNIMIQVENADPNIKIKLSGKEQIAYMTYRWNDEEEVKLDINAIESEQEIKALPGENILTITAVDINNETETIDKTIEGLASEETENPNDTGTQGKPTVTVTTDGSSNFVIKASDSVGLVRVECILNGEGGKGKNLDNLKEYTDTLPFELSRGRNTIEVTVYNANGQKDTFRGYINPQ